MHKGTEMPEPPRTASLLDRFPKVSRDGMTARVLLSFLTSAGLYYVNIMPALVDGLKQGLGFTNKQAGLVGSFNVYGAACGAFLMAFLVRRIRWRVTAHWLLAGLIGMDLLSMLIHTPPLLMGARFVQGFIGGLLVGLGFSIIARTKSPDRTFGVLLLVQVLAGGLGVMTLPLLVPTFGTKVLFVALILFSLVTVVMLQFLPDYPVRPLSPQFQPTGGGRKVAPLLLALFSVFLFQSANMGLFAFAIGLGKSRGLPLPFVSHTLGMASWVAITGALLVIVVSTRFGIFRPILLGMLLALAATWSLTHADIRWVWIAANFAGGIAWNFVISHLLGMCARFDQTGQVAVWSGFFSKMGLASGPMLASFIVAGGNYSALIATTLVLLTCAIFASALPAWMLDRAAARAGATQTASAVP
jgi:MFS family permease